jgi:predicted DNA-binding transcriptional regulator YafY
MAYNKQDKKNYLRELLSPQRQYSQTEILDRFMLNFGESPSERTFYKYIEELENEGAPLQKVMKGKIMLYSYTRPYSWTKNPLKPKDAQKLHQILKLLDQMKGLPQIEDLRVIVKTLEQQANLQSGDVAPTMFLDHKPMSKGILLLGALEKHIEKKEVIEMEYRPFYLSEDKPALKMKLHPTLHDKT